MKNILNQDLWGRVAFFFFCLSTIFMVFFSTMILEIGPKPWNKILVLMACVIPLVLVLIWKVSEWKNWRKTFQKEMLFIPVILILGILNVVFSEGRATSFKIMTLFFLSGVSVFFVSRNLFETKNFQKIFMWVCWASLVILFIYGFFEYLSKRPVLVLSYNPILASSMLLLLLVAPFVLIYSSSKWLKPLLVVSVICGMAVILLTGKRGAALGLLGMGLGVFALIPQKKVWIFLALVGLVSTGWMTRNYFPDYIPKGYFQSASFTYRLENYPFAWHIFKKHPFFGVGFHAPLVGYMKDYKIKTSVKRRAYKRYIKKKYTLENTFLCGFVELGGLFAITYITFVCVILRKYLLAMKEVPRGRLHIALFLPPLIAFGIQAMTYDGLVNGHLNWLFHSYLGLMANFGES